MASQITVAYKGEDGRAKSKLSHIRGLGSFGKGVSEVSITDVYTIDKKLPAADLKKVAKAFHNPLIEKIGINRQLSPKKFAYAIEIGFLPGVTDNVGRTAQETIEDVTRKKFKEGEKVYSSRIFYLSGKVSKKSVEQIAESLYNPLIQRVQVSKGKLKVIVPKVNLKAGKVDNVNLNLPDEELTLLGKAGVPNKDGSRRGPLGLGLKEVKAIKEYFDNKKRKPTDAEIEALAQTWSEHCKHTIFANPLDEIKEGIYKRYIKGATNLIRKKKGKKDFCVSVFKDNSGIIEFDKDTLITHKVETHNSPSALDPFGGAITGIVGVNRDTLGTGMGAKPALNFYGYCFAEPTDKRVYFRDKKRTKKMLSPKRIMEGVIEGVNAGGNQSGIPTPQGFVFFEPRYIAKPLVFVGTVGILPKKNGKKALHTKSAKKGNYIVMVGGRVGLDGIHGATFSSEALDSGSPATAVQVGDAITQKKLSDAIVKEAQDKNLYNSITDNGAGGLSSSVGEMANESGGCEVWLDKVPVKYPGLSPWQIWISESQERMTLAVPKNKWKIFSNLMKKRGVEATMIGEFTNSGKCLVKYGKKKVVDLDMEFLHDGLPINNQETESYIPDIKNIPVSVRKKYEKKFPDIIRDLMSHSNVASTEFISKQYDHEVQGSSVTKPLQGKGRVNAYASVSRPKLDSKKGVVMSQGLAPKISDIDAYHMAASSIDQSIRNAVAIGGNPSYIALLDNFCWCSSDDPKRLDQLKSAAQACFDYAISYEAPYISGKDSMFNDFKGFTPNGKEVKISVPPTLLISSISVIPDHSKSVTLDFKKPGDVIYVLGETKDELGRSEYETYLSKKEKKEFCDENIPIVDAEQNMKMYKAYYKAVQKNLVSSAIPVNAGGIAVALAKSIIAGKLGVEVDSSKITGKKIPLDAKLFAESNGRILVSVAKENSKKFETLMKGNFYKIGKVTDGDNVKIDSKSIKLEKLLKNYRKPFKNF